MRAIPRLFATLAALLLPCTAAHAQSVLRDAETEALFHDLVTPLVNAAGMDPRNFDVVLVNDPSINAFTAGGQAIYLNSGIINIADNAGQIQGVLAHELGHVTGGHVLTSAQAMKESTRISLLSLLLGAAAMAAGGGEAGMGVLMMGQQAALSNYLGFSKAQESQADAAGVQFLAKAGISGKGSIAIFKKLEQEAYRAGYSQKELGSFMSDHPIEQDRISALQADYEKDPAWNKPGDPALDARFRRIKAKLYGYLATPADTLKVYPVTDNSVPARYARAYAWHKDAYLDKAMAEVEALLAGAPDDPYFLEVKGQILLEAGHPQEAIAPLERATRITANQPLIATTYAHALIATDDPARYPEAERVLKAAVSRDRENPDAWYQLGMVYAAHGDLPRARLASAEQQAMSEQWGSAARSAEAAMNGLPANSADWLRAQDIMMQARAAIEHQKKRK